ncbi:MAG: hypothetical protein KC777_29500 [Cyanobacteria bacterium HKST-UBA02]|nr:hypothetical protein [Cyanobacteria bacterium HKST-UBA02]
MTSKNSIPIGKTCGVEHHETGFNGIVSVQVTREEARFDLTWDRFVRLEAAALAVKQASPLRETVLDVGGFDGALALFLSEHPVHLIDPATTGACALETKIERTYRTVVSVDVLEHVVPGSRRRFLEKLAGLAGETMIINYPCRESEEAQKLVFEMTGNSLIKEHVEYGLPDTEEVLETMREIGFEPELKPHSSLAVWTSQYLFQNSSPEEAGKLNRYLVENHALEDFSTPLYHLVVGRRKASPGQAG